MNPNPAPDPSRPPASPPPLPPVVPQYASPGPPPGSTPDAPGGDAQAVFDTITGPNVRLRDNLIQLAVVVGGASLCAAVGWFVGGSGGGSRDDAAGLAVMFGIGGALASLILSGVVIGIVRGVQASRRRKGR